VLEIAGQLAAIFTAIVAAFGYGLYRWERRARRRRLEMYLKEERLRGVDRGQRTLLHLVARVGLTEAELLQAAFDSRVIERRVGTDPETKRANALFLEYSGADAETL